MRDSRIAGGGLRRFARHAGGGVAVMFALALVPLCLGLGLGLDYARAASAKWKLDAAADAAVLAALASPTGGTDPMPAAEARARAFFDATATDLAGARVNTREVRVTEADGVRSASLSYAATTAGTFSNLIGRRNLDVSGTVTAGRDLVSYGDIYLVLDVSGSMGLAADAPSVARLKQLTRPYTGGWGHPDGCAFGCHLIHGDEPETFFGIARRNGVRMRVDVLSDSASALIAQMRAAGRSAQAFRLAMYSFESNSARLLEVTGDLDLAATKVAGIALGLNTLPEGAMAMVEGDIGSQGSGRARAEPRKTVVLVTDGVRGRREESNAPFSSELCGNLKRRGFDVAVIDVTYLRDNNGSFNDRVKPFYNQISDNLRLCASPGLYYKGSEPDEIRTAFERMFRATQDRLRLTQ